jgi:hypothetical protein
MSIRTANRSLNGRPSLFINDKGDNPIGINMIIGKRPLAAFGTFEGVREMLEYTGAALNDFSIRSSSCRRILPKKACNLHPYAYVQF